MHVQHEVEPIVVVLLLAVVTDYSVFFLSGMLGRLREGEPPAEGRAGTRPRKCCRSCSPPGCSSPPGWRHSGSPASGSCARSARRWRSSCWSASPSLCSSYRRRWEFSAGGCSGPGLRAGEAIRRPRRSGMATAPAPVAHGTSRRLGAVPTLVVTTAALVDRRDRSGHTCHLALTPVRGLAADAPAGEAGARGRSRLPAGNRRTHGTRRPRAGDRAPDSRTEAIRPQPASAAGGRCRDRRGAACAARSARRSPSAPGAAARCGTSSRSATTHTARPGSTTSAASRRQSCACSTSPASRAPRRAFAGDTAMAAETTQLDRARPALRRARGDRSSTSCCWPSFLRSLVAPVLLVGASLLGIAATLGLTALFQRGRARHTRHDLLRPARRRRAAALARDGLQPVHRRADLAGGRADSDLPSAIRVAVPRASRAISIAAPRARGIVRDAGDHPDRPLPVVRLRRLHGRDRSTRSSSAR